MQLIAARTRTLFRAAVGTYADILQLFVQIAEQLFFGIKGAFQRRQHLIVLVQLRRMGTHRVAGTATFSLRLLQALAQFFIEVAVAVQHFRRIRIAEVGTTLNHFAQRKRLLTRVALHLLRIGIVFFQLFKLFRVALQD